MAYWGLAVNAWGNPVRGRARRCQPDAGQRGGRPGRGLPARTPQGEGFIAASTALYRDAANTPNAARLQAYADTMARLYRDQPNDDEVAIYHALALIATAPRTDTTFAQQRRAAAILNPLFARHPDHPGLAHYIIHSTDSPQLASLGLDAARRYARIAPAAPHAQHMPSHIFVRLGLWDETVASNWASYRAGSDYAKAVGAPEVPPEALHALDYAVYGYLQRGEDSAADSAIRVARSLHVRRTEGSLVREYNGTAMLARIPLERGDWSSAAALALPEKGIGRRAGAHPVRSCDRSAAERPSRRRSRRARGARQHRGRAGRPEGDLLGESREDQARRRGRLAPVRFGRHRPWTGAGACGRRHRGGHRQAPRDAGRAAAGAGARGRHAARRGPAGGGPQGVPGDAQARARPGAQRVRRGAGGPARRRQPKRHRPDIATYLELMRNADGERAELAMAKTALR